MRSVGGSEGATPKPIPSTAKAGYLPSTGGPSPHSGSWPRLRRLDVDLRGRRLDAKRLPVAVVVRQDDRRFRRRAVGPELDIPKRAVGPVRLRAVDGLERDRLGK